ncbi:MAG: hypothetical protein H6Q70_2189 [Firmicutes bacterium]|nr:hypothetical protein [Bacillota bacterium]
MIFKTIRVTILFILSFQCKYLRINKIVTLSINIGLETTAKFSQILVSIIYSYNQKYRSAL